MQLQNNRYKNLPRRYRYDDDPSMIIVYGTIALFVTILVVGCMIWFG